MNTKFQKFLKRTVRLTYLAGSVSLLAGLVLSVLNVPASAADLNRQSLQEENTPTAEPACSPPKNWEKTDRFSNRKRSKEWHFEVEEPEMNVSLEWIYFQDYDQEGCPFDCSAGDCQTDEIGEGTSPFGDFTIDDGHEGADGGRIRQHGTLTQGSYTASFHFTGSGTSSVNVGLKVHIESIPTDTPPPPPTATATDEPAPTATPTDVNTVVPPPGQTATPTPTETEEEPPVGPPTDTPTPTETEEEPPVAPPTETPTPVTTVLPPEQDTPTPTATEEEPEEPTPTDEDEDPTPPATLAPPKSPPDVTRTPALVPVTGADLAGPGPQSGPRGQVFVNLGIALLGLGLTFHGISRQLSKR
jgi:hypothetical protein